MSSPAELGQDALGLFDDEPTGQGVLRLLVQFGGFPGGALLQGSRWSRRRPAWAARRWASARHPFCRDRFNPPMVRSRCRIHPSGGHQVLHGPLAAAQQLAAAGNPPAVLDKLRALLATELTAVTATRTGDRDPILENDEVDGAPHLPRRSGPRELAADYLRIATTGLYDTDRYRSPSEARQAARARCRWLVRPSLGWW